MIAFLRGKLSHKTPNVAVIDVNGIGFSVLIPLPSYEALPEPGKEVQLQTYLHLRENDAQLFGFMTGNERALFEKVIGVSGIGPQLALGILSAMSAQQFKQAIFEGDVKALSQIPRIGKKTAERLILELKDKFKDLDFEATAMPEGGDQKGKIDEAVAALVALGYKEMESRSAIVKVRAKLDDDFSVEDLIREGLQWFQ